MIQAWVNDVTADGLSPRSVVKDHALPHKIFARAVGDRAIQVKPASHTALSKVVTRPKQIITAAQFEQILLQLRSRDQMMVLLTIETGLRWGELIALRPCDIDLTTHVVLVRRTIGEVAQKHSPTGQRIYLKDHPKDDEQRSVQIDEATCQQLQDHTRDKDIDDDGPLLPSAPGQPCHATTSGPNTGPPPSTPPKSNRPSPPTTCEQRMPPGCWPAAQTSSSSKNASDTDASPPPSSTPAPSPTPATAPPWPSGRSATAGRQTE